MVVDLWRVILRVDTGLGFDSRLLSQLGGVLGTRLEPNYVTKADSFCQIIMLKGGSGVHN